MDTPITKKNRARGIHGRSAFFSLVVSPGATNDQSWYRRTGIARMIPTTIAIRRVIANASPGPRTWSGRAVTGSGLTRTFWIGSARTNPIAEPTAMARMHRTSRVRSAVRWSTRVITPPPSAGGAPDAGDGAGVAGTPTPAVGATAASLALRWSGTPAPRTASASAISGQPAA